MMLVEGGRRVAIRGDEPTAMYTPTGVVRSRCGSSAEPRCAFRIVVELRQSFGGMVSRALLGAEFVPDSSRSVTTFETHFSGYLVSGAAAECRSELGGSLVAGLPRDFSDAAHEGIFGESVEKLPSGLLRIDRAAFDEVGSSEKAFHRAGVLLARVSVASLSGADPIRSAREVMGEW